MLFSLWDFLLLAGVSSQVIVLAYIRQARLKAFMLMLPIPFTFSTLAVGRPIDATNAIGLGLFFLFMHVVRLLYSRAGLPIIAAIAAPSVAYCLLGIALARIIPPCEAAYWIAQSAVLLLAVIVHLTLRPREEHGHRSTIPLHLKIPLTLAIVFGIILLKKHLQGFMTFFPMVGVFAAYETRRSLWTTCRQVPVLMMLFSAMMIVLRLSQNRLGLGPSLLLGWALLLSVLIPLFMSTMKETRTRQGGSP